MNPVCRGNLPGRGCAERPMSVTVRCLEHIISTQGIHELQRFYRRMHAAEITNPPAPKFCDLLGYTVNQALRGQKAKIYSSCEGECCIAFLPEPGLVLFFNLCGMAILESSNLFLEGELRLQNLEWRSKEYIASYSLYNIVHDETSQRVLDYKDCRNIHFTAARV